MGVGSGLYMYDVVVKRSRSLSHLLMSSCYTDEEKMAPVMRMVMMVMLLCFRHEKLL